MLYQMIYYSYLIYCFHSILFCTLPFKWQATNSRAVFFTLRNGNFGFKHPTSFRAFIREVATP